MGLFSDRRDKRKELGRDLAVDPTQIAKEMELIDLSLATVEDWRQMTGTAGWKILEEQLGEFVKQQIRGIYSLANDPLKNQSAMVVRYAMAEAIKRFLTLVRNTIEEGKYLEHRKSTLINR